MTEKDKTATREKLLEAVGRIIRESGFAGVGINSVAREAGVSKVLIYRYFGGLEELVKEWVLGNNYWYLDTGEVRRRIGELAPGGPAGLRSYLGELLAGQIDRLRSVPEAREMIRWYLCGESSAAGEVMERVERRGIEITGAFLSVLEGKADAGAMVALLISGIYYLALVSDRTCVFNGVPLDSDEGWGRISGAVDMVLETLFNDMEVKNEQ